MICPHCKKHFVRTSNPERVLPSDAVRFWKRVTKLEGDDACWEFNGRLRSGYGAMTVGKRQVMAHIVSWVMHNGPIPPDKVVAHSCDNPRCVRPSHLESKTQSQNMQDMVARGRDGREKRTGDRSAVSKLTDAQALEVSAALANKTESIRSLSKRFNVTFNCIYQIGLGLRVGIAPVLMPKQRRMPPEDVFKIRELRASGVGVHEIGRLVGWCAQSVSKVILGQTHKRVQQLQEAA